MLRIVLIIWFFLSTNRQALQTGRLIAGPRYSRTKQKNYWGCRLMSSAVPLIITKMNWKRWFRRCSSKASFSSYALKSRITGYDFTRLYDFAASFYQCGRTFCFRILNETRSRWWISVQSVTKNTTLAWSKIFRRWLELERNKNRQRYSNRFVY